MGQATKNSDENRRRNQPNPVAKDLGWDKNKSSRKTEDASTLDPSRKARGTEERHEPNDVGSY